MTLYVTVCVEKVRLPETAYTTVTDMSETNKLQIKLSIYLYMYVVENIFEISLDLRAFFVIGRIWSQNNSVL